MYYFQGAGGSTDNKSGAGLFDDFDFDDADEEVSIVKEKKSDDRLLKEPVSLKRHVTWPVRDGDDAVMSVKVKKEHKEVRIAFRFSNIIRSIHTKLKLEPIHIRLPTDLTRTQLGSIGSPRSHSRKIL